MEATKENLKGRANSLKALEENRKAGKLGRPKGSKSKKTIAKEKAWVGAEQEILQDIIETIRAQKHLAQGIHVMMVPVLKKEKNKKGKWVWKRTGTFRQETNPQRIAERLEEPDEINGEDYYFIHAEKPNPKALEDVISRVFGRSKDKDSAPQDPFYLAFRQMFLGVIEAKKAPLVNPGNATPLKPPTRIIEQKPEVREAEVVNESTEDLLERARIASLGGKKKSISSVLEPNG